MKYVGLYVIPLKLREANALVAVVGGLQRYHSVVRRTPVR